MRIPEIPTKPWESIAVDFIMGLPPLKDLITRIVYTSAIIIVCKMMKYTIIILMPANLTTEQLALLMLRGVFVWTGLPKWFTSNRDKLFTLKFWKMIMEASGTSQDMSTAHYQQTDGQSERMIQSVEQYLRHYLDWNQDNWVELLPMA
jgi:hypothetical protein